MTDPSKFFEFGKVTKITCDDETRQAAISVSMPCSLMQSITPILLGGGLIDNYEVMNPIAAWLPRLESDSYKEEIINAVPNLPEEVHKSIEEKLEEILKMFKEVAQTLKNPESLIPMLPLGLYVQFRYRFQIDELVEVLEKLGGMNVIGVAEFRYSLASALASILQEIDSV